VPDDNFEQVLIDLGYDNVLDDHVVTANINTLTSLEIQGKNISNLTGIEDFTALTVLDCDENQLANLDITQNIALEDFSCKNNQLTSLDLSNNTDLKRINCENNQLSSLNVKNGNNSGIESTNFNTSNNASLSCIEVDDASYSTVNWTNIDAHTSFSEDCSGGGTEPGEACASYTFDEINGSNNTFKQDNINSIAVEFNYLNSFQLEINGTPIHSKIIESKSGEYDAATNVHIKFADNSNEPKEWLHEIEESNHSNFENLPRLKVVIEASGKVSLLGTRETISTQLEEMKTVDGTAFNTINFVEGVNTIKIINIDEESYDRMAGTISVYCNSTSTSNGKGFDVRQQQQLDFMLYPNPVKNLLNLSISTKGTYLLFTSNGQLVSKGELEVGTNAIDTRRLANGMYYINIQTKSNLTSHKFIKQ